MPGPIVLLLLLLSIAVLTVLIDRCRFWTQWLRRRNSRSEAWKVQLREEPAAAPWQLEDWNREMAFGESLLQASILLGPLLGLIGTVWGLMDVLAQLGPQLLLPANANLQGYGKVLLATALGLVLALVASAGLYLNQGLRRWQLARLDQLSRRLMP